LALFNGLEVAHVLKCVPHGGLFEYDKKAMHHFAITVGLNRVRYAHAFFNGSKEDFEKASKAELQISPFESLTDFVAQVEKRLTADTPNK